MTRDVAAVNVEDPTADELDVGTKQRIRRE
jgi:hypothetical protein